MYFLFHHVHTSYVFWCRECVTYNLLYVVKVTKNILKNVCKSPDAIEGSHLVFSQNFFYDLPIVFLLAQSRCLWSETFMSLKDM